MTDTFLYTCVCSTVVDGPTMEAFGDAYIAHVRAEHKDWPFPDLAVRNYAEATQRLTGGTERLDALAGEVTVEPVTAERIDDWLSFFDHDGFTDNPAWAACYCTEPFLRPRVSDGWVEPGSTWQQRRETAEGLLRSGVAEGYLAYVDGKVAGWVNASKRSAYSLYRQADEGDVPDGDVVGVSCFVIAPPYRRHGVARELLDRVVADAAGRGAKWVEAYPAAGSPDAGSFPSAEGHHFRGPQSMYEAAGFEKVAEDGHKLVVRRPA